MVNCTFDTDNFMCGYTTELMSGNYFWKRQEVNRRNMRNEPVTDGAHYEIGMVRVLLARKQY